LKIPIKNVYYLLSYAWERLEQGDVVDVSALEGRSVLDLLGKVLAGGVAHLLRRGIDRGYVHSEEVTSQPRGRFEVEKTLKGARLERGLVSCSFDEMTHDVLHNRIVASTLRRLLACADLDRRVHDELVGAERRLREISTVHLQRSTFRRVQLHRNNMFYDFLLKTCELIFDNLMVDESAGTYRFRDFLEDDARMWRLFQAFVRNFYQRELPTYQTTSETIDWDVQALDESSEGWLPQMLTDITLRGEGRTIIIDTKFHRDPLQTHYQGKRTVKSENLYQLMSYLKNAESRGGNDAAAVGILLYPQTEERLRLRFKISGHEVRVFTVNLSEDWKSVHQELLDIVAKAMNTN
jgi:5-methylcytosine-specific restriction enzyme subunit McrC